MLLLVDQLYWYSTLPVRLGKMATLRAAFELAYKAALVEQKREHYADAANRLRIWPAACRLTRSLRGPICWRRGTPRGGTQRAGRG